MQPITVRIPDDPRLLMRPKTARVTSLTAHPDAGGYPRELIALVPLRGMYHRKDWRTQTLHNFRFSRENLSLVQRAWIAWEWFDEQLPDVPEPTDIGKLNDCWIAPRAAETRAMLGAIGYRQEVQAFDWRERAHEKMYGQQRPVDPMR